MLKDGETVTGDALPEGGQPSTGQVNPSEPQVKMIPEEEVNKRHSKLDKTISQLTRELKEARDSNDSTASELGAIRKELDDAKMAQLGDDPEKISAYQLRRTAQEERTKAAKERADATRELREAKAEREALAADKAEITIGRLAIKYKIPERTLSELGITDSDALEKVAVTLAANMKVSRDIKDTGLIPDSGLSTGGKGEPTQEDLTKMSEAQYHEWASKRYK